MLSLPAAGYPLAYGDATIRLELGETGQLHLARLNASFSRRAVSRAWRGWRVVEAYWTNDVPGLATFSRVPTEVGLTSGIVSFSERGISWTFWPEPDRVLQSDPWPFRKAGLEPPKRPIENSMLPLGGRIRSERIECDDGHSMVVDLTPERLVAVDGLEKESSMWNAGELAPRCFVLEDRFGARLYSPSGEFVPLWTRELRLLPDGVDWMFCRQDLVHVWSRRVQFDELRRS